MGYRIVRMNRELFTEMMTEGWTAPDKHGRRIRCVKGLPEGAKLEGVSMDPYFICGDIAVKFSHPSWPDQEPGTSIPMLDVQYSMEQIKSAYEVISDWTSTSWAESTVRLSDESRSLVWNIPNVKGETVERRFIPAGSWMNYRDGIRVRMPGAVCDVLLPLSEVEYHDGQPLAPIRRDGVDYPPNADATLIVGS